MFRAFEWMWPFQFGGRRKPLLTGSTIPLQSAGSQHTPFPPPCAPLHPKPRSLRPLPICSLKPPTSVPAIPILSTLSSGHLSLPDRSLPQAETYMHESP